MRLDGMTDRSIVRLLLTAEHDNPAVPIAERATAVKDADIDAMLVLYLQALEREARGAYVAMPGARELIDSLAVRDDVLLGLCTGNLARGAELKLAAAGLWGPFSFGGFGSDAEQRA